MKAIAKRAVLWLVLWCLIGTSVSAQQPTLPLKVSENGRYFVDQTDKPVFWLGTTQGELFHGFKLDDAKTFLAESSKKGFMVVQVKLMGGGDGTVPNAYGQKIWINDDPLMPNEAYFKNVDAVVQAARDNNMTVLITLYHQLCRKYITLDNARSWAKSVAQRYKDAPNVIWSMTPEAKQSTVAVVRELAAGLHEGDGGQRGAAGAPPRGKQRLVGNQQPPLLAGQEGLLENLHLDGAGRIQGLSPNRQHVPLGVVGVVSVGIVTARKIAVVGLPTNPQGSDQKTVLGGSFVRAFRHQNRLGRM
jgi:hypothetical protein